MLTLRSCVNNTRKIKIAILSIRFDKIMRELQNRDSIICEQINLNAGRGGHSRGGVMKKTVYKSDAFSIAEWQIMVRSTWRWRFDEQRYRPTPKCTLAPPRREPHRITSPTPPCWLTRDIGIPASLPARFSLKSTVLEYKHDADWRRA